MSEAVLLNGYLELPKSLMTEIYVKGTGIPIIYRDIVYIKLDRMGGFKCTLLHK